MKCCDINAGQLTALITIERKTRVSDGMGGSDSTWASDPAGGVWAKWKVTEGARLFTAEGPVGGGLGVENRITVTMHFRGDVYGAPYYSAKDRVVYRNRTYSITSVVDAEDRQEWLVMALLEGSPS